ncbi:MAG: 50S ribosomal protein L29 [Planctomycetia bacterium]|nr:50S ribosomal protein L29 [Planctomycetia bacterium]
MKAKEIREMSNEQRFGLLKETEKKLFDLRVQAKMERLDSPSEVLKARRTIAKIKTVIREMELASGPALIHPIDEAVKD